MTPQDFHASLAGDAPPQGLSIPLAALWWDDRGDWTRAHDTVAADEQGRGAAWVHAYLHRREGDAANARYWYSRAGRPFPEMSLETERDAIVEALTTERGTF